VSEVVVVDYGCGNIQSLERALKKLGVSSEYTSNSEKIKKAQKIILPGVGSYATGMSKLEKIGLIEVIKDFANSGKPLLGICLGMQLLLDYSEEFGSHKGLGIIHGSVTKFKPNDGSKVPHTGWNSIELPQGNEIDYWNDPILNEISPGKDYYFVHSYMVKVNEALNCIAETTYGGIRFSSIIKNNNVYGCQFHPEKSGVIGSKFLENFINIK
jgi:imidazole glycerol-phosphate synthase subunit HisH